MIMREQSARKKDTCALHSPQNGEHLYPKFDGNYSDQLKFYK
jgi:hypothetical protein